MELSSITGLHDLQETMEDSNFFHEWHLNTFDDPNFLPIAAAFGETLLQQHSFSNNTSNFNPETCDMDSTPLSAIDRPTKQLKTSHTSCSPNDDSDHTSSDLHLLSFANPNYVNQMGFVQTKEETLSVSPNINGTNGNHQKYGFKGSQVSQPESKKIGTSPSKVCQPHDHIIAERKRREKLSQRFIALSALVPGLKKIDKASILGDAIKYLKQLHERVKSLEEEQTKGRAVESVVIVRKSQVFADTAEAADSNSNNSSDCGESSGEALPEIEARFCERDVLIRIHCERSKGVMEKAMGVIESLHLTVTNTSSVTFGTSALDITIIAQMDTEFCMTLEDLVRNLRSAFKSFM